MPPPQWRWYTCAMPNHTVHRAAPSLLRRLIAMVYDTLLVLPIIMAVVALGMAINAAISGSEAQPLHPQLVQALTLITCIVFFTLFWRKSGQTLGMQAWRIQLVSFTEETVTVGQCIRRCLGATLSAVCFGLGYWWCLFDRNKRCWHDYLSGTELILLEKKKKTSTTPPAAG